MGTQTPDSLYISCLSTTLLNIHHLHLSRNQLTLVGCFIQRVLLVYSSGPFCWEMLEDYDKKITTGPYSPTQYDKGMSLVICFSLSRHPPNRKCCTQSFLAFWRMTIFTTTGKVFSCFFCVFFASRAGFFSEECVEPQEYL